MAPETTAVEIPKKMPAVPQVRKAVSSVGVDLSGEHVRIVYARPGVQKLAVESIRQKKFQEGQDVEISQFILSTFQELKIKKRSVVCVLPSKLFISKNIDMPSKDPEEIRKILDLQANRYTPYSRDEIVIDFLCMETPGQHYTNVLLIIVNRKVIERYYRIFESIGVEVESICIASEGMASSFTRMSGLEHDPDAVAGIHMAYDGCDLTISERTQMVFVRSIPIGMEHFKQNREEAQNEFLKQLNKSIIAYQNQGVGRAIKAVIVTGLVEGLASLEESMRTEIPYFFARNVPIKVLSYSPYFDGTPETKKIIETEQETSFFEILSCLNIASHLQVDMVPKEIKLKRRFREGGREALSLGITIMAIFMVISVFLGSRIYLKHIQADKLETAVEATSEQAKRIERTSTKNRFLRSLLESRGKGLYAFEKISALVGTDIYLSDFRYDSEGKVKIAGTAASMSRVFSFVTDLEESGHFKDVKTTQSKSRREGENDVADFEMECAVKEESA